MKTVVAERYELHFWKNSHELSMLCDTVLSVHNSGLLWCMASSKRCLTLIRVIFLVNIWPVGKNSYVTTFIKNCQHDLDFFSDFDVFFWYWLTFCTLFTRCFRVEYVNLSLFSSNETFHHILVVKKKSFFKKIAFLNQTRFKRLMHIS